MSARPSSSTTTVGGKTIVTRTLAVVPRLVSFTAAAITTPTNLARMLMEMQQSLHESISVANSLPLAGGNWFRNLAFAANVPLLIAHGLGHAYRGWIVTRLQASGAASVWEPSAAALAALSPAVIFDPTKQIPLEFNASVTADIFVF